MIHFSRQHLLIKSHQWKHEKNMRNLFKASNKDTRMKSMTASFKLNTFTKVLHSVYCFRRVVYKYTLFRFHPFE